MPGLRLPPHVPSTQLNKTAAPSSPSLPQQDSKRAAEEEDDERGAERQRHNSAAPSATAATPPPPPPQGTKRRSEDEKARPSEKQKRSDSARQLRLVTEELFKLEERRDVVAAKYQDLPLRVRRDVRHQHANDQFVLAALLQHVNTPHAAAALPDVEAETPIAELCPRDINLLREAKLAVGEAAIMGEDLTLVQSQIVLRKIAAADDMLTMIEAMVTRLNRSYGESPPELSERAIVISWNLVCQRVQQGIDINIAIQCGRQFLVGWAALDGFVATKYEERRFFCYNTLNLFQASEKATDTADEELDSESGLEDDEQEMTEPNASKASPASSVTKSTAEAVSKRPKRDARVEFAEWKRQFDAEEAARKQREEQARSNQQQPGSKTTQPGPFDTSFLPNAPRPPPSAPPPPPQVTVGIPQPSFSAYDEAWNKLAKKCGNADLPLPLFTNNVAVLRAQLMSQLNNASRSAPGEDHEKRRRLRVLHDKTRDYQYTDDNIIKFWTELILADAFSADFKAEEIGGQAAVKLYWDEQRHRDKAAGMPYVDEETQKQLGAHHRAEHLKVHNEKLDRLHAQFKQECKRWHEDMLDRRTGCKNSPVEQRTSQITMVKAIYNGIMSLQEQVERALQRGGENAQPGDKEDAWVPDPDPED